MALRMLYHSLINSRAQHGIIAWGRAASCHLQPISVVLNRPPPIRCLNRNELVINKIATIYKTQKIIQLKDIYNVEVRKFMYTNAKSWLPATFINYFKLITDVYSYNTKQVKTRQFALPKARSKSGAKMIKLSAVEIWSKMPLEIKNKQCLALFSEEYKKTCITQLPEALFVFFLLVYIKHVH